MATRAESKVTMDHDEIRRWAEERGAQPACVRRTGGKGDIGMLRLDFPGYSGEESLEHISWDEFFEKFDERNLALLHQDTTARGAKSNFNKLVSRDTAEAAVEGGHSKAGAGGIRGRKSGESTPRHPERAEARAKRAHGGTAAKKTASGSRGRATKSTSSRSTSSGKSTTRKASSRTGSSTSTRGKKATASRGSATRSAGGRSSTSRASGSRSTSPRTGAGRTTRKSASTRPSRSR